ncbi:molybdate ABC transporter permease subunit [Pseudoteredinibacter isoporae]|uniref:molybdate ABC transporter permease subunit n=1 Tax=Pseudoteredinibacter isoporae TaxID=570281 RepID=UPI00310964FB
MISAQLTESLLLTIKLAGLVTISLVFLCTLLSLIVEKLPSVIGSIVKSILFLPLVLPPTVLGFYLLVFFSVALNANTDWTEFAFTFEGLVIGSVIYSLPFVYQPIQNAINAVGQAPNDLAATMGAGPIDRFFTVTLPLAKDGFIAASILGFAHTIGEFGVVLMIGGNIPGETQVLSVLLYEYVEMGDYESAHKLSAILLTVSFLLLFAMYRFTGSGSSMFALGPKLSRAGQKQ